MQASIKKWKSTYFQEAVNAIIAADEDRLVFLLGPNLLTLNNPLNPELLFSKFKKNDQLLIDGFYDTAEKMITGFQQIFELKKNVAVYEAKVLPDRLQLLNKIKESKEKKEADLAKKAYVLDIDDNKTSRASPQFFTPSLIANHAPSSVQATQNEVDTFIREKLKLDRLTQPLITRYIMDFSSSPYAEIKEQLVVANVERELGSQYVAVLNKAVVENADQAATFFETLIESEIKNIAQRLIDNLKDEIAALQKNKKLTENGIKKSYSTPISNSYVDALMKEHKIFSKDLGNFRTKGRYQDLSELLVLLKRRRDESIKRLKKHNQDFVFEVLPNPEKTILMAEEEYKASSKHWLANQDQKQLAQVYRKLEIENIIDLKIGLVRFDKISDEKGNTLLHYAMLKCWEAKNSDTFGNEGQVERLMSIFTILLSRGASVYARNLQGQTVPEFARFKVPSALTSRETTTNTSENNIFHHMLNWNWASSIKVMEQIPCATPKAQRTKVAILEYSRLNEERVKNWDFIDRLLYNYNISAYARLRDVGLVAELLFLVQEDISDLTLKLGVEALSKQAQTGFFGKSKLYDKLSEIFNKREDIVFIPLNQFQLTHHKELEMVNRRAARREREVDIKFDNQEKKMLAFQAAQAEMKEMMLKFTNDFQAQNKLKKG